MTSLSEATSSNEIRLLIVDDDSEIRAELGAYLSAHFFWVQTAANGEEAERLLADGEFDIILLDLWLGNENGFDVLRRMRSTSRMPVLLLTARGETVAARLKCGSPWPRAGNKPCVKYHRLNRLPKPPHSESSWSTTIATRRTH